MLECGNRLFVETERIIVYNTVISNLYLQGGGREMWERAPTVFLRNVESGEILPVQILDRRQLSGTDVWSTYRQRKVLFEGGELHQDWGCPYARPEDRYPRNEEALRRIAERFQRLRLSRGGTTLQHCDAQLPGDGSIFKQQAYAKSSR